MESINTHKPLLEDLKSCIWNFDNEKKNRIIYQVDEALSDLSVNDPIYQPLTKLKALVKGGCIDSEQLIEPIQPFLKA